MCSCFPFLSPHSHDHLPPPHIPWLLRHFGYPHAWYLCLPALPFQFCGVYQARICRVLVSTCIWAYGVPKASTLNAVSAVQQSTCWHRSFEKPANSSCRSLLVRRSFFLKGAPNNGKRYGELPKAIPCNILKYN